jgi:hypothetical protein
MRWPGKVVYLEQGFRRKLMKMKMFMSEVSNQDEVIPSSAGKRERKMNSGFENCYIGSLCLLPFVL